LAPVAVGTQRSRRTPLPKKKTPSRLGKGWFVAAQASPLRLSIASNVGRAKAAAVPPMAPRSSCRLES
jgi:hypothetical protein